MKLTTQSIGAAAVHFVCADVLLSGHQAFLAAESLRYDMVIDRDGRLFRVQVKGCSRATIRGARPAAPSSYTFNTSRNRQLSTGATRYLSGYRDTQIDILAAVALDIRVVAYFAVIGKFMEALHLFPPGTPPFLRNGKNERRNIDRFPIEVALAQAAAR